jgi:hypothetical protein
MPNPPETGVSETKPPSVNANDGGGGIATQSSPSRHLPKSGPNLSLDGQTNATNELHARTTSQAPASGPAPGESSNGQQAKAKETKGPSEAHTEVHQDGQQSVIRIGEFVLARARSQEIQPTYSASSHVWKRPTTKEEVEEEARLLLAQANRLEERSRNR